MGCSKPNDPQFYKESISRGKTIVAAIERYEDKNNSYPVSLEALVPEYIGRIPKSDINNLDYSYLYFPKAGTYSLGIIVEPSGLMILGAKAIKELTYDPNQNYQESKNTQIHFTLDGWALRTQSRS